MPPKDRTRLPGIQAHQTLQQKKSYNNCASAGLQQSDLDNKTQCVQEVSRKKFSYSMISWLEQSREEDFWTSARNPTEQT